MKIAYLSNVVEPTGGDHILYQHFNGLRNLGHKVDAYFSGWHESYNEIRRDWNEVKNEIKIYTGLKTIIDAKFENYDVVVGNGLYGSRNLYHVRSHNKVWFCQNFDPYVFGPSNDTNKNYMHFNKYLLYSHDLAKIIKHYYGDKNFVYCNNGVEYKRLEPHQKTRFLDSKRVCFMVAYYRNYKGIKLAEQIFHELKKRGYTTVEINVIGGPLNSSMEYFRNPPSDKKAKIIAGCDVCIHPSVFETWNLVSMESMALGTPVVGVNSKGIMEYATKDNSIIFEDRDPIKICDAIDELCNNKSKYSRIQEGGIITAKEHDWDFIMPQIEESYKKLIS